MEAKPIPVTMLSGFLGAGEEAALTEFGFALYCEEPLPVGAAPRA
jgi:hypothetical protein